MGNNSGKTKDEIVPLPFLTVNFGMSSVSHSGYLLSRGGDVFSWGCGDFGQLGNGRVKVRDYEFEPPEKLEDLPPVVGIAAGANHAMALSAEGHVYCWGHGELGRLGLGDQVANKVPTPKRIPDLDNVIAISCGNAHGLALTEPGHVYSWGRGDLGQLGHPPQQGYFQSSMSPRKIESLGNIVAISCGTDDSLALTADHELFSWGLAKKIPTKVQGLKDVFAIAGSNLCLKQDGTVWTFDKKGTDGPIQIDGLAHIVAIASGGQQYLALDSRGQCFAWGKPFGTNKSHKDFGPKIIVQNAVFISAHAYHNMVITDSNEVIAWGHDSYGRLGTPEVRIEEDRDSRVTVNGPTPIKLPRGFGWHWNSHAKQFKNNFIFMWTTKWIKIRWLYLGFEDPKSVIHTLPKDLLLTIAFCL